MEKDRVILECFTSKVNVVAAIDGSRPMSIDNLFGSNAIPDTVCDENIDVRRIEKYFNQTGWHAALENFHKKEKSGWTCLVCHKHISKLESSAICERCLGWCHISFTNLKRQESKSRNWFFKLCTIKFTYKSFCSERLCTLIESKILVYLGSDMRGRGRENSVKCWQSAKEDQNFPFLWWHCPWMVPKEWKR